MWGMDRFAAKRRSQTRKRAANIDEETRGRASTSYCTASLRGDTAGPQAQARKRKKSKGRARAGA